MCVEFVLYYFFQQKKEINKLAVRCTDFLFVVEILGCCGRKPLPILTQMLIVSCNSSWLPLRCSQLPFICCFSQTEVITNYIPCCTQEVGHLVFFSFISVLEPKWKAGWRFGSQLLIPYKPALLPWFAWVPWALSCETGVAWPLLQFSDPCHLAVHSWGLFNAN